MKADAPLSVDTYLEALPLKMKKTLQQLRATIRSSAPKAEEVISYKMPAYRYHGMLVYFAAFREHCSLFPASKNVLEVFKEELKPFKTFGGTIQFTPEEPLPAKLVKQIVEFRMRENEMKKAAKKAR